MINPKKVLPLSLEQLANCSLEHRELYEITETLTLTALFSRYSEKRRVARLELDSRYNRHVFLVKQQYNQLFYVYMRFSGQGYILIGKYNKNCKLEAVPTPKDRTYFKMRSRILEDRLSKKTAKTKIEAYKPQKTNITPFKLPE